MTLPHSPANGKAEYDPDDNSRRSYDLAIAALREVRIRRGLAQSIERRIQRSFAAEKGWRTRREKERQATSRTALALRAELGAG